MQIWSLFEYNRKQVIQRQTHVLKNQKKLRCTDSNRKGITSTPSNDITKEVQHRHQNHSLWFFLCTVSQWQVRAALDVCVCVSCVYVCVLWGQLSCGEVLMKCLSAPWNTSAAPFSHALCLFKVTSERGICIGKRNSECKELCCSALREREREPAGWKKWVSYMSACTREEITGIISHYCTSPGSEADLLNTKHDAVYLCESGANVWTGSL